MTLILIPICNKTNVINDCSFFKFAFFFSDLWRGGPTSDLRTLHDDVVVQVDHLPVADLQQRQVEAHKVELRSEKAGFSPLTKGPFGLVLRYFFNLLGAAGPVGRNPA